MRSALPNASSTQLEILREEFTRLAASVDWSVEQDVDQLIASAGRLAGLRLPPDDRVLCAERCVCQPLAAAIVFPAPLTSCTPFSGWVYAARS
jgi:hypothetical protein